MKIIKYFSWIIFLPYICFGQKWKENIETYPIQGITESNFIKPDRETDFKSNYIILKNSNFLDLNRAGANLEKNITNYYSTDLYDFFKFELIPKSSREFSLDSTFNQLDFERVLNKIYRKHILYAFDNEDYFDSFIKNISAKLFHLIQNNSNLKSHRIIAEVPYKLNETKTKKRKKIIPAEFDVEILCYIDKDGSKRIRFFDIYPLLRIVNSTYMFISLNGYSKTVNGKISDDYKNDIKKSFYNLFRNGSIQELIENQNDRDIIVYFITNKGQI